jgi:hypothetical protein
MQEIFMVFVFNFIMLGIKVPHVRREISKSCASTVCMALRGSHKDVF